MPLDTSGTTDRKSVNLIKPTKEQHHATQENEPKKVEETLQKNVGNA